MDITNITSHQILDSRGRPTLETKVWLDTGVSGVAAVPAGASTGSHEALELRDKDLKKYFGQSVGQAMANVQGPIAKALKGQDVRNQRAIDQLMIDLDGTVNKSALGANAILSVSLAVMRAHAELVKTPLYQLIQQVYDLAAIDHTKMPRPMMNIINGGLHADSGMKIQECLIIPEGDTFAERLERGTTIYHHLGAKLKAMKFPTLVGDEGGFAPKLPTDEAALDLISAVIKDAGLATPGDIGLGLDFAATTFYDAASQRYQFGSIAGGLNSVGMSGVIGEWLECFPLISIEDPLAEDDWDGWADLTAKFGSRVTLIGDDLFVTNRDRLDRGIAKKVGNAILIKPNQIGTLSETIDTILRAQEAKYLFIISHRSGETADPFISDLAVATGAPLIKAGAPARGERVTKYNRLLAIEEELTA